MASDTPMGKQAISLSQRPGSEDGGSYTLTSSYMTEIAGTSSSLRLLTTRCWGFSAQELAKQFSVDAGLLLLNNQIGALTVQVEIMPTIGTTKRVLHTFEIPLHSPVRMIVNIGRPTGRTGYGL